MSKTLKAASWYIFSNFLSKGILYIITPILTRLLTLEEYGTYSNFLTWQTILMTALTFDLYSTINIAFFDYKKKSEINSFISSISFVSILIPFVFAVFIFLNISLFENFFQMNIKYIAIMLSGITISSAINIFQAEQRIHVKYKLSSFITITCAVGTALLSLTLCIFMPNSLDGVLYGNVCFNILINMILYYYIFKRSKVIKLKHIKYAMVLAIPLLPHLLASNIFGGADKIMIMNYCGSEKTALYSLIFNCSTIVTLLASSLNQAWVPWFYQQLKQKNYQRTKKMANLYYAIFGIISVFICLISPEIVKIFGGEKYMESIYLVPPILLGCVIRFLYTLYVNIQFYNKKTVNISIATIPIAIINIILNYIFINLFDYSAAAYTTLFSNILLFAFHYLSIKKQGFSKVFDDRKLGYFTIGFSIIILLMLFLFRYNSLRYCLIFAFVSFLLANIIKYKKNIFKIMQSYMK